MGGLLTNKQDHERLAKIIEELQAMLQKETYGNNNLNNAINQLKEAWNNYAWHFRSQK